MPRSRLASLVLLLAGTATLIAGFLMAPSAAAGPAGNNGTVKIDGTPFDSHPDNQPHVGCRFEVDFYGFDAGQLFADVTFALQPPTGTSVLLVDRIFIGEDDNSGGGSTAGLDAQRAYDLTDALSAFAPQLQQGWHVKLTVAADGAQGADVKHKVFWVEGCSTTTTTSTSTTSTSTTSTSTTSTSTTSTSTTSTSTTSTTAAAGPTTTASPAAVAPATVLGTEITRAPVEAGAPQVLGTELSTGPSALARTGGFSERLLLLGSALVLLGAGLILLVLDDRRVAQGRRS